MTNLFKKTALAAALAATALAGSAPAMADGYRHHGGDGAGIAIGAGIVGLALGAIIASDSHHDRYDRRYDRGYYEGYNGGGYYGRPYVQQYWARDGYRHSHENREYREYSRRGYGDEYRSEYRGYEGWRGY